MSENCWARLSEIFLQSVRFWPYGASFIEAGPTNSQHELCCRFYASLDTLTEPHKLTSTLLATASIARMVVDPGERYPEAKTHVIPMLMAVLPGKAFLHNLLQFQQLLLLL